MDATPSHRRERLLRIAAEEVVRPSFERCCEGGPEIFDTFYATLADNVAGVGPMFAETNMQKQNELIREGISTLIDFACGDEAACVELERLAALHDREHLGVNPEMYSGWVGALMQMVSEFDPQRTENVEAAWREVVAPGIELLASRYDREQPPPPASPSKGRP